MVDRDQQRVRYIGGSEGAPPVPPPGGYRGARRVQQNLPFTVADKPANVTQTPAPEEKKRPNALGWIALFASGLFVVVLFSLLRFDPTTTFYQTTLIALQVLLLALIIAALVTKRGRMLGAIALSVALVFNIGSVGAISAVQASETGNFEEHKSDHQRHEEAFPGIKDVPSKDTLAQPSLEEMRARADAFMADVRRALTDRFGYTWVKVADETLRPERNGYGGESMLVRMYSPVWAIEQSVHDYNRKLAIMSVIESVAMRHDFYGPYSLNDDPGFDDSLTEKLYGSSNPRTQHTWEWYAPAWPDPGWMYVSIWDLTLDSTGELRKSREAMQARSGEPLEGLQLVYYAAELLSEADRAEFIERMRGYPGR
jgi:hypothetical protein